MNQVGARYSRNGSCCFTVWAPEKETMTLHIVAPAEQKVEMVKDKEGYFSTTLNDIQPGCRYFFMPNGEKSFPDPASFFQPEGVHGPSEVVDHDRYEWLDAGWRGLPLSDLILYEMHVGAFTHEGTFISAISRLDDIAQSGINAIEIMPVAQFPGNRNWGYDGVYQYATQHSYGGPNALKKFVDACHARGIAVILDVVYNHFGPEGNYLAEFAPYFTDKYKTPWGRAINFDGQWSDGVRDFFCNNALYWLTNFHIDGLRIDAIHEMYDFGAVHVWDRLNRLVKEEEQRAGRTLHVIAESDLNNPKIVKHPEAGGYGFDAQWLDDFHHALYVMVDKKGIKRYEDFGRIELLAKVYTDGFAHSGEYVRFRKRKYGASSVGIPGNRFIAFIQNHDQIGNSSDGARLSTSISFDLLKVSLAALLLSPYIPMLFMGEEYGEDAPFPYFVHHSDAELIRSVKEGRKNDFKHMAGEPESYDPQSEGTFAMARIDWAKRKIGKYKVFLDWTQKLIGLRKTHPSLRNFSKNDVRFYILSDECFALLRRSEDQKAQLLALFNLSPDSHLYKAPGFNEEWTKIIDSTQYVAVGKATQRSSAETICAGQEVRIPPCSVTVYSNSEDRSCKD
jgi:maltooligosyltrehalose trehalohydrolase